MIPFILGALAAVGLSELSKKGKMMKGGIMGDIYSLENPEQFKQLITIYNDLSDYTNLVNGYYIDHYDNSIVFLTTPNISDIGKDKIYNYVNSLKDKGFSIINWKKTIDSSKYEYGLDWGTEKGSMVKQEGKDEKANPKWFKLYLINRIKYAKGGGVGKIVENKYAKGGKINEESKKLKELYKKRKELDLKRANWIGGSEYKSILKSPYDDELDKIYLEIAKQEELETEFYDLPQSNKTGEKKIKETAWQLEYFIDNPPYGIKRSYSKFLKSLKTPTQKEAFRKLMLPSYQKRWGRKKPIINKKDDTIRLKKDRYAKGGEVGKGFVKAYYNESISSKENGYQVNLMFYNSAETEDYFDEEFITTNSPKEAEKMAKMINKYGYEGFKPKKYAKGGMLSNKEKIVNLEFEDNTDRKLGRYDFSFETVDADGASVLDYDGYIIESAAESRMPDEFEWGQNVPEDWENAEKYILDSFYEWKRSKMAKGGEVASYRVSEFFAKLFQSRDIAHKAHLQTDSYAAHVALNEYYDGVLPLIDGMVESYQGEYGKIEIDEWNTDSREPIVEYFENLLEYIDTEKRYTFTDSSLLNQVDEIKKMIQSTLYKLKELK